MNDPRMTNITTDKPDSVYVCEREGGEERRGRDVRETVRTENRKNNMK